MVRHISPKELAGAMAAGIAVYLIDVRKPDEHERARLPGSLLLPLDELTERADEITPPAGALIVAYCHHGVRSVSAAVLLDRLGIRVSSLRGGIDAWSREVDPSVPRY